MSVKPAHKTMSKKLGCWQFSGGSLTPVKTGVVMEHEFPVYVNGRLLVTASITPTFEREFALGYLFGQGFINSLAEVESLEILNNTAQVTLKDKRKNLASADKTNYRIVSGGGRSAYLENAALPEIKADIKVSINTIFTAMNKLFSNAALYAETEGVHAAALFSTKVKPLCMVEDIGRHNTLDKIIGYVLRNKIDCTRTILVSTGRMSSEMVTKICRCGIPIAATKTAITDKGLEIGKKCGLTLIGFVRDAGAKTNTNMSTRVFKQAGMKIYSGAARIRCE
jgi:FdhD protein